MTVHASIWYQGQMKEATFTSHGQSFRVRYGSKPYRVEVRKEFGFAASAWFSPSAMLKQIRGKGCIQRRTAFKTAFTRTLNKKSGFKVFHSVVR